MVNASVKAVDNMISVDHIRSWSGVVLI